MAGDGRFKGIVEGDEVERFLKQFVVSDAERAALKAQDPKANVDALPKDVDQVLKDVKEIWQRRGFTTPAELKAQLIQKYLPDADPKLKQYIQQVESARTSPERTTGYLDKEHAYNATGLAHLYAKETGKPIAMVEADFSNMGGTNLHFEEMLKKENPGMPEAEIKRRGMHMTDEAVGLLCKSLTSELRGDLPLGAKIVPIRTGGDEIRIIVTGVEGEAEMQRLTDRMHATVEKQVAAMGLQDHPHLKAPNDPVRNGFGVALAMQDMRQINNPETLVQELDARIKVAKTDLGMYRLGMFDEGALRAELQQQVKDGTLEIPKGQTAEQVINARVAETAELAQGASKRLHEMNPVHNTELTGGSAGFENYVRREMSSLGPGPLMAADVPQAISAKPFGAGRPEGVAPLASLEERWNAQSRQYLESEGVTLSSVDKRMLALSVGGLAAQDPSAQTFMPKIVGPTVEAFAAETEDFRKQWDASDPKVKSALSAAGLAGLNQLTPQAAAVSFHNLAGLNNALGHHQADLVLREMAGGIIEKSLNEAGIPPGPPKPYAIAHHGGGNFTVMIQPGGKGPDGTPWFASEAEVKRAEQLIAQKTEELNHVKVTDFLEQKGIAVTQEVRDALAKEKVETFGDIQDPKVRKVGLAEGRVNGLHAVSESAPMVRRERDGANPGDGFGFMGRLRDQADAKMNKLRDDMIVKQSIAPATAAAKKEFNNAVEAKGETAKPKKGPKGPKNNGGGEGGGSAPVVPKKPAPKPPAPQAKNQSPAPAPPVTTAVEKPTVVEKPVAGKPAADTKLSVSQSKFTKAPEEGRPGVQSKAGHAVGAAQVGVDIMEGKYGKALEDASLQVALNPNTYKAAATLTKEGTSVAKVLGVAVKKVPILGAVLTVGTVAWEVGSNIYDGKYAKALTATGAGAAEIAGNIVGFGVGDAAREGVRETIARTAGDEYAPDKSGLRTLIENGVEAGSKFMNKPQPETVASNNKPRPGGKPPAMG